VRIIPADADRTYRPLSNVIVDLDTPVIDVDAQGLPPRQGIAHRFSQLLLLRNSGERVGYPSLQIIKDRPGILSAEFSALVGRHAPDTILDVVERTNAR